MELASRHGTAGTNKKGLDFDFNLWTCTSVLHSLIFFIHRGHWTVWWHISWYRIGFGRRERHKKRTFKSKNAIDHTNQSDNRIGRTTQNTTISAWVEANRNIPTNAKHYITRIRSNRRLGPFHARLQYLHKWR